jgi:hypothetical protein
MARKKKLDLKGLHPKAQAVAKRLKNPEAEYQRLLALSNFYNNKDDSKEFITVEVFVYAKVSEKKVAAKKVFFQVPASVAEAFPYNLRIDFGSNLYEPITQVFTFLDPNSAPLFYRISETEVEYIKLFHRGKLPKPETTDLAKEKVADGTQPIPQHPHFNPTVLIPTTNLDCLPFYLVQHLEKAWNKYYKEPLSQHTILRYLNRASPILSVKDVEPFLQKYRLHLKVVDLNDKILYEYQPAQDNKKRNKDLPSSITFLQHNAHITPLNHNLNSYIHKQPTETHLRYLDFHRDFTEITTDDELKEAIKRQEPQHLYYTGSSNLFQLFHSLNLEPQITVSELNEISSFILYNPHKITVRPSEIALSSFTLLKNAALQPNFKSYYSESFQRAINDLKRGHLRRSFIPTSEPKLQIDIVRSYSANLKELDFFPVFSKTDSFQPFNGELEPYTVYLVHNTDPSPERYLIANQTHNLVSGYVLQHSKLNFTILAQCRPSNLEANTIRDSLHSLYKDPTNPDLKSVANITLGLTAKLGHSKATARFTTSINEAHNFSDTVINFEHGYLSVKREPFQEFEEGYFGIAFLIYDLQRLRMLNLYRELTAQQITVYGVATDAFFVDRTPNLPFFSSSSKTWDDLGKYQIAKPKATPIELAELSDRQTSAQIEIFHPLQSTPTIQQNTFTTATIAGAGKSYTQFQHAGVLPDSPDQPTTTLIVIQSTKQILSTRNRTKNADVITYAQFLGHIYDDEGLTKKVAPYDTSLYKILILDELLQIPPKDYLQILSLCRSYPHLQILGNGDDFQNSTGTLPSNYTSRQQFYEATLPYVFTHRQHLTKSRRLTSSEDEDTINSLKGDLQSGLSIPAVITKYNLQTFTNLSFAKGKPVIPFTNLAGALLSADSTTSLKFKGYDKNKLKLDDHPDLQFDNNVHFVIENGKRKQFLVKNQVYTVKLVSEKGKHFVKIGDTLYKRSDFTNPQATTGHSCQGDTIREPYVILEANHFYATPEWFYTALTRATRLKDVYIYTGASACSKVKGKIADKLKSYAEQDYVANREYKAEDFITSRWITDTLKKQNYCCSRCYTPLSLDYSYGDPAQFSVNRHNNDLPHIRSNCEITCLSCNQGYRPTCSKSD